MSTDIFISEKIKYFRHLRGMSQEQLSEMVGYKSRNAIYNIEHGRSGMPIEKIIKVAEILEVPFEELICLNDNDSSSKEIKEIACDDVFKTWLKVLSKFYNPTVKPNNQCEMHDGILLFNLRNFSEKDQKQIVKSLKSVISLTALDSKQSE